MPIKKSEASPEPQKSHLLEPTYNAHFVALLDHRHQLNRFPVSHEDWEY